MSRKQIAWLVVLLIVFVGALMLITAPKVQEESFPIRVQMSQDAAERGELLTRWQQEAPYSIEVAAGDFEQMHFSRTLVLFEAFPEYLGSGRASFVYVGEQFGPDYPLFWATEQKHVSFQMRSTLQEIDWRLENGKLVARSRPDTSGNLVFGFFVLVTALLAGRGVRFLVR